MQIALLVSYMIFLVHCKVLFMQKMKEAEEAKKQAQESKE
jgi:hypothetical protein